MSQFLVAVGSTTVDGGRVGTTEIRFRLADVLAQDFDGVVEYMAIGQGGSGYGKDYDPTYRNILALAYSLLREAEGQAAQAAARLPPSVDLRVFGPQWAINFHIGIGDSGAFSSIGSMPLAANENTAERLALTLMSRVERAAVSDDSNALNRNARIWAMIRPHTGELDSAGCDKGIGEVSRHLFNPPSHGECLVWCLLHHVKASESANAAKRFREQAQNIKKGKQQRSTAFLEFRRRLLEFSRGSEEPDWTAPDEVMALFYAAGHKLEIHIEFGPEEAEEGEREPQRYGIHNGWPVYVIVRRQWHFYAVIDRDKYRADREGMSRHTEYVLNEERRWLPALQQPGRKRAKLMEEDRERCGYCDRVGCARDSKGKGRTAGVSVCPRCGRQPRNLDCAGLHATICTEPIRCKTCAMEFSTLRLREKHDCRALPCPNANCDWVGRHTCLLQPIFKLPPVPLGFVAYDMESAVTPDGYHRPVCVCVSWVTFPPEYVENFRSGAEPGDWLDLSRLERQRERYVGERAIYDFAEDLILKERWARHVVAAHNGARYDARLLMDTILQMSITEDLDVTIVRDFTSRVWFGYCADIFVAPLSGRDGHQAHSQEGQGEEGGQGCAAGVPARLRH